MAWTTASQSVGGKGGGREPVEVLLEHPLKALFYWAHNSEILHTLNN